MLTRPENPHRRDVTARSVDLRGDVTARDEVNRVARVTRPEDYGIPGKLPSTRRGQDLSTAGFVQWCEQRKFFHQTDTVSDDSLDDEVDHLLDPAYVERAHRPLERRGERGPSPDRQPA